MAEEYNDKIVLENFSDNILTYFDLEDDIGSFESYEKAFSFLGKQSNVIYAKEQIVIILIIITFLDLL